MIDDPLWPRVDQWLADPSDDPEVSVVGLSTSVASLSPSRADLAPDAMWDRMGRFSTYHGEEDFDLTVVPVAPLGNLMLGDISAESLPSEIADLITGLPDTNLALYLGGDNAITRPIVRSHGDLKNVGVITLDAHHDVRSTDPFPSNGSPIRGLIEDGLPGRQVAQIGIHSFANSQPYRHWCDGHGIGVFTMTDVDQDGIDATVSSALDHIGDVASIHVDVDMDVLDSAFAPGCPGARPGGMTPRQLARAVRLLARDNRVTSVDFVEVDPERDRDGITIDAAITMMLEAVVGYGTRE
ncbi:MAG: hypothetical protein GEU79_12630 [Acidimicrobiia bacterium]|nr:hypothetical protein [Acidimicrobiia bacterium]